MTKEEQWNKALLMQRVIWGSLLQGAGLFAAVVLFSGLKFGVKNPDEILSAIAVGVGALAWVASLVLPSALSKASSLRLPTDPPVPTLAAMWLTESVLRWALLEGGAIFCGIAYLVEQRLWVAGAAAVLLATLAWQFPSMSRRDAFLRRIGQAGAAAVPASQNDQLATLRPGGD